MPVIVVGNEKNFAALRPRLLSGRISSAALRDVTGAIAAANPHADLNALEPGTVLTVPDLPHVNVRADVSLDDPTKETLARLARAGAAALEQLVANARESERAAAAERKQLAAALDTDRLGTSAARRDKNVTSDLKAVRDALNEDEAAAKDRTAALQESSRGWSKELEALRELFPEA